MSMVRMFHVECDAPDHDRTLPDIGDEWYSFTAKERAKEEGWHLRNDDAICPVCWEQGVRFKNLEETR